MTGTRPGWRRDADVAVVGSGAAGIAAALTAAASGLRVLLVTKDLVGGATSLAQGGLAAALGPGDSAASHVSDTLTAGAGLCEPRVVGELASAAPGAVEWLVGLGARLDRTALRLEGGHSQRRIVHSGNDATGAEVHRSLLAALLTSEVEILDRTVALDLLVRDAAGDGPAGARGEAGARGPRGAGTGTGDMAMGGLTAANASALTRSPVPARAVAGFSAAVIGAGGTLEPGVITARAVVIAAGGLGQVFATTSNPAGATGDGIAMAARAGAVLRDLEFVQFHPTVLWVPGASGQCPLITEALRGAGAVLRDLDGQPLMAGHHPRGDLAPRDVVAARIHEVMAARGWDHVWLDATGVGREVLEDGFPTVTAACRKHGIDPVTDYIPVAPGAHYSCGGVLADLDGQTTIGGLYAVGEAASTGVQGANRLASNSVTEAVIAGRRCGDAITAAFRTFYRGDFSRSGDFSPLSGGNSSVMGKVSVLMCPDEAVRGADGASGAQVIAVGAAAEEPAANAPGHDATAPGHDAEAAKRSAEAPGPVEPGRSAEAAGYGSEALGRAELAGAMSRFAGVMRDSGGLEKLAGLLGRGDESAWRLGEAGHGAAQGASCCYQERGSGDYRGRPAMGGAVAEGTVAEGTVAEGRAAGTAAEGAVAAGTAAGAVADGVGGSGETGSVPFGDGLDLEAVEAANLRLVSQLIVAGALRRAESRGCHRRRDAAVTAERAWHTLLRWDGERLVVSEETL